MENKNKFQKLSSFVFFASGPSEEISEKEKEDKKKKEQEKEDLDKKSKEFEIQEDADKDPEKADDLFEKSVDEKVKSITRNYKELGKSQRTMALAKIGATAVIGGASFGVGGLGYAAIMGGAQLGGITAAGYGERLNARRTSLIHNATQLEGSKIKEGISPAEKTVKYERSLLGKCTTGLIFGDLEIKLSEYSGKKLQIENIDQLISGVQKQKDALVNRRNALKNLRNRDRSWVSKIGIFVDDVRNIPEWWEHGGELQGLDLAMKELRSQKAAIEKEVAKMDGKIAKARMQAGTRTAKYKGVIDNSNEILEEYLSLSGTNIPKKDIEKAESIEEELDSGPFDIEGKSCRTISDILEAIPDLRSSDKKRIIKAIERKGIASAKKKKLEGNYNTENLSEFETKKVKQRNRQKRQLDIMLPKLEKGGKKLHVRNLPKEVADKLGVKTEIQNLDRESGVRGYISYKGTLPDGGDFVIQIPRLSNENTTEYIVKKVMPGNTIEEKRPIEELTQIGILMSDDYQKAVEEIQKDFIPNLQDNLYANKEVVFHDIDKGAFGAALESITGAPQAGDLNLNIDTQNDAGVVLTDGAGLSITIPKDAKPDTQVTIKFNDESAKITLKELLKSRPSIEELNEQDSVDHNVGELEKAENNRQTVDFTRIKDNFKKILEDLEVPEKDRESLENMTLRNSGNTWVIMRGELSDKSKVKIRFSKVDIAGGNPADPDAVVYVQRIKKDGSRLPEKTMTLKDLLIPSPLIKNSEEREKGNELIQELEMEDGGDIEFKKSKAIASKLDEMGLEKKVISKILSGKFDVTDSGNNIILNRSVSVQGQGRNADRVNHDLVITISKDQTASVDVLYQEAGNMPIQEDVSFKTFLDECSFKS